MNIFTGGHYSSGSRVIQMLLEQTHNIACDNIHRDYEIGFSEKDNTLAEQVLNGKNPKFPISEPLTKPFSLKNPDFMMMFPYLKKRFPEAKLIIVVRDGIDQILCSNRTMTYRFSKYFKRIEDEFSLEREMKFWNFIYKRAIKHADLIIRLEDLVHDIKNML